ncbi:MAG: HD domain-containing protein, partial [Silvanigrellaceae bacterium]|nr:HD domain-containing protein [Silvanigrellaceae bacterium]
WREYLRAAAYLHECGLYSGRHGFHKHSAYFLHHAPLPGFTERETHIIALIVRFHRKRLPCNEDEFFKDLTSEMQHAVRICASFLRLATSLDRTRMGKISELKIHNVGSNKVNLNIVPRTAYDMEFELYDFMKEKKVLEDLFFVTFEVSVSGKLLAG